MIGRLKRRYRVARLKYRFLVRDELGSPTTAPLMKRIAFVRRGFLSKVADYYNLTDYTLDDYVSDMSAARLSLMYDGRNGRAGYQYGLNNKIFATALLGRWLRLPVIHAVVEHGRVVTLEPASHEALQGSWLEACRRLGGALVFKPSAGACGGGVFFVSSDSGELTLNGEPASEDAVASMVKGLDEYIIVEFFRQGPYGAGLFAETTNTVRVLSLIDPETGEPHIPIAVQRIGRMRSRPVDNWARGGCVAEIDLETGMLSRAATLEGSKRTLQWHDEHPDTGAAIKGVRVPGWEAIKAGVLDTHRRMAYYKFMTWDIVPLEVGFGVLEADTSSDVDLLQMHRPLLSDAKLRRFMEFHGLVKGDGTSCRSVPHPNGRV